jgi:hypothetical protein
LKIAQFDRLFKERVKTFNIANVYEERANKKIKRVDNEISIKQIDITSKYHHKSKKKSIKQSKL